MDRKIGMMVELDYCVGCYACQSACQAVNELPVTETYLRCILQKPEVLQGEMQCFMSPVPYDLDHCAECVADHDDDAPCQRICIGHALHFMPAGELAEAAAKSPSRVAVFA